MFDTRNRRTCRGDLRARVVGSGPRGFELGSSQQPGAEQLLLPAKLLLGVSRTRLAGFLFIWRKLPETKGKSLEQIERSWTKPSA